jgi:hypothetical protein
MKGGSGTTNTREANIDYFMSAEFLESMRGKSAGEYSQACRRSDRWGNEKFVPTPKKPKVEKAAADDAEKSILGAK